MKRSPLLLSLFAMALLCACDQTAVKKEAYEQGFAAGREAGLSDAAMKDKAARAAAAARATPPRGSLDPRNAGATDPQVRRILPNSQMQGSALDKKTAK